MENVGKDKDSIILLIIVGALVGWNIFITKTIKTDVTGYEKKLRVLK